MTAFKSWSTDALRGYVVMLSDFVSGSVQEENLTSYNNRLASARAELLAREEADNVASIAFSSREVVTHEGAEIIDEK